MYAFTKLEDLYHRPLSGNGNSASNPLRHGKTTFCTTYKVILLITFLNWPTGEELLALPGMHRYRITFANVMIHILNIMKWMNAMTSNWTFPLKVFSYRHIAQEFHYACHSGGLSQRYFLPPSVGKVIDPDWRHVFPVLVFSDGSVQWTPCGEFSRKNNKPQECMRTVRFFLVFCVGWLADFSYILPGYFSRPN